MFSATGSSMFRGILPSNGVSVFVGVPLLVENLYNKVMKQIEKQGKTKTVRTGLKLSAFTRKLGIDMRRKIFGEIIEKLEAASGS